MAYRYYSAADIMDVAIASAARRGVSIDAAKLIDVAKAMKGRSEHAIADEIEKLIA